MKEDTKTQKKNKPQTKNKSILNKILNVIINIMIVCVLIVSLLIAIFAISSKSSGISTIFGTTFQPIQSDSMKGGSPDGYPGGDFEAGDLMLAKPTGFDSTAEYELGDIVTFLMDDTDGSSMLIVHRIVDVKENSSGVKVYQTQGDNRETSPVPDQAEISDYIGAGEIGSVYYTADYEGKILKGWGKVLNFLQSQRGFFFAVLLPMIIFFIYELIRVFMNVSSYRKAKDDEDKKAAVEAAVAEALAGKTDVSLLENASDEDKEQFRQFLEFKKQQESANAENAETETEQDAEETAGEAAEAAEETAEEPEEETAEEPAEETAEEPAEEAIEDKAEEKEKDAAEE